jgi:hypothetical protein
MQPAPPKRAMAREGRWVPKVWRRACFRQRSCTIGSAGAATASPGQRHGLLTDSLLPGLLPGGIILRKGRSRRPAGAKQRRGQAGEKEGHYGG